MKKMTRSRKAAVANPGLYNHLYQPALTEIVYHEDDKNLDTIRVQLPKPPPLEQIDGYGLEARATVRR